MSRQRPCRPALRAFAAALLLSWGTTHAGEPKPALYSALTPPAPAPAPSKGSEGYVDRVLETGPQKDVPDAAEEYDARGWARSLRLETSLSASRGPSSEMSRALAAAGYVETPQYGTLSLQATLVQTHYDTPPAFGLQPDTSTTSWRIDQRALALGGGWRGNHGVGNISTLVPLLARGASRVYLPSAPIAGLGGQWLLRDDLDVNASVGQPGLFSGFDVSAFNRQSGTIGTAGGQARLWGRGASPERLDGALQVIEARDTQDMGIPSGSHVTSTYGSLAWEGTAPWGIGLKPGMNQPPAAAREGGARLQWSFLQSDGDQVHRALGNWVDAGWRTQMLQNAAGVYRFDPGLMWGATAMPGNLQGGYWRADVGTRQWQAGWNVEATEAVSGSPARSVFANLYGRYLLSLRDAVDATLSTRAGLGSGQSLQLNWDHASDWGQSRWRTIFLESPSQRTRFVGIDQTWPMPAPTMLGTSFGWQTQDTQGASSSVWTWSVLASVSPAAGWALDANVHGAQSSRQSAFFANLGLTWQLARDWALAARYTESRGQDPTTAQLVSALTAATIAATQSTPNSRSLQVLLRYDTRAGTLSVPLGGTRLDGAGGISGTVFFDADHDGRREPSEQGAPNVTVILDGRYVARTDTSGRYEFPFVVVGKHTLQVQPDNVPLPWSPASTDPVGIEVLVRGTTVQDFPLQRDR